MFHRPGTTAHHIQAIHYPSAYLSVISHNKQRTALSKYARQSKLQSTSIDHINHCTYLFRNFCSLPARGPSIGCGTLFPCSSKRKGISIVCSELPRAGEAVSFCRVPRLRGFLLPSISRLPSAQAWYCDCFCCCVESTTLYSTCCPRLRVRPLRSRPAS